MNLRRPHLLATSLAAALAAASIVGTARAEPASAPVDIGSGWQLQDVARVPESGALLSQGSFLPTGWYNATVPGTVLTSLVNDGVYPEPLYGENNRPERIPDSLCRTSYWYRTQVAVPASYAGRQLWLSFDGINSLAEGWVKGQCGGESRAAFSRGVFNVTPNVRAGQPATIAVH